MSLSRLESRHDATFSPTISGRNADQIRARPCKFAMAPEWRAERFARLCRERFPLACDAQLAAEAAVPIATVRKHLAGTARPGADALLAYLTVLGPELLAVMLPACAWAERAADDEARRQLRDQLEHFGRRL